MQGQILQLNDAQRTGLILGSDGARYSFGATEWRGALAPGVGLDVDFVASEGVAREIFPVRTAARAMGSYAPASGEDNSVTVGWLGVGALVLSFVIPVLPLIAAFILGLMGAGTAKRFGNSSGLLLSRIAWVGSLILSLGGVVLLLLGITFFGIMAGFSFHELMRGNWGSLHHTVAWLL